MHEPASAISKTGSTEAIPLEASSAISLEASSAIRLEASSAKPDDPGGP